MSDPIIKKDYGTDRICSLMLTHQCNLRCIYCFEKFKGNRFMTFETAKKVLSQEFKEFEKIMNDENRMGIDFMGGEPMLNFELIKQIYEWVMAKPLPFPVRFTVTTNGTLLTDEVKNWLKERKQHIRVVMSVDGTEFSQKNNRGVSVDRLPLEFVHENWPNSYFKQTLSHDTLPFFAESIIELSKQGYRVASSLAQGHTWQEGDVEIYRRELKKLAEYYLEHKDVRPETPFDNLYREFFDGQEDKMPKKACGVGTSVHFYDVDGQLYPCHLFLPMVHGKKTVLKDVKDVDFNDPNMLVDDDCKQCPALKVCNTCYGYNYVNRGNIAKRDKSMCNLYLAEAQVVSEFQIAYFVSLKDRRELTDYELLMLQCAVRCYKYVKDIEKI